MFLETMMFRTARASTKEKMALQYRQLAVFLVAGVAIKEAIDTLINSCRIPRVRQILIGLKKAVDDPAAYDWDASEGTAYYNPGFIYLLLNGEQGKPVAVFLNRVADELDLSASYLRRIAYAMGYPFMLLIIASVICSILLVFVIPVFQDMFGGFGTVLPVPTMIVILLSEWMVQYFHYIVLLLLAAILIILRYKAFFISLISRIPILGMVSKKVSLLQFLRYFSVLSRYGIPTQKAVVYASGGVDNGYFSNQLKQMGNHLSGTASLESAMTQTGFFPDVALQAAVVGEKSGALGAVFDQVSQYYEKEVEIALNNQTRFLDMFFILLVGGIVGALVIAMYLPIFTIASVIS